MDRMSYTGFSLFTPEYIHEQDSAGNNKPHPIDVVYPIVFFDKVTKNINSFPVDEAALKLLYISMKNIQNKWTMQVRNWSQVIHQFSTDYEGKLPI